MSALRDFITNTGIFCGPSRDEAVAELDRLEEQYEALRVATYHAEMCMFAHHDERGETQVSLPLGDWLPVVAALQAGDSDG